MLFFVLDSQAQEQYFQGRLSLKIEYFDSLGTQIEALDIGRDTEMHYFISGGDYKSYNEEMVIKQLYNASSNQYFFNHDGELRVLDASYKFPASGEVEHLSETSKLIGKSCNSLLITSENDQTKYFYSDEIKVDKSLFQNHNFGLWNLFLNSSDGSLALRYEIKYPATGLLVVMEVYEIEELELSGSDFDVEEYIEN